MPGKGQLAGAAGWAATLTRQYDIHTVKEWVDVPELLAGCRVAVELAKQD